MDSMTTNDKRFYDKYEKFRTDCRTMENIGMAGIKIDTNRVHFGVRGIHLKLGKELDHEEANKCHRSY